MSKNDGTTTKVKYMIMGIAEGKSGEKGTEEIIEAIITENSLKLMIDIKHQFKNLREHQTGYKPKIYTKALNIELWKFKDKKKILKETRAGKCLTYREAKKELLTHQTSL